MLRRRRLGTRGLGGLGTGLLTVAVTAALIGPAGPAQAGPARVRPAAEPPATATDAGSERARTVTLITGDRVTVRPGNRISIKRAEGREGIQFLAQRLGTHLRVVPSDALALVNAGRLDERLFDVTTLIGFGYHDGRGDLPLILTGDPAARGTPAAARAAGVTVVRDLPAVDGVAVRADKGNTSALWRTLTAGSPSARTLAGGARTVWLDGVRKPALDVSVPQIGAPQAWRAGYDGAGVKVAVLDTGIDEEHPDLAGQVVAAGNFTEGEEDDEDRVGHGTHVASTIAGTGAASDGRYTGVAPKARLLDGKVCVEFGCLDSWIIAGMQWAADQGAKVVNMSLGGPDRVEVDPVEQALAELTDEFGMLFVVAAGNSGADATIGSPASADAALAVGAVTKTDELAEFSSRGPRVDGGLKPDITAPGEDIVAANSADGFLGEPGEAYTSLSGTSMATPHVAGAAAILAQRRPQLPPAGLKALLMGSAKAHPDLSAYAQGAGRVDVARAINQTVSAEPPSVGFGRQPWPHGDDTPDARTVTYRNAGDAPVTLSLSVRATGPDGKPAPAGFFTLGATSLTVPAGGTASVTLSADPRVGQLDGYYTGRIVATAGTAAGAVAVTTPFAVDREVESYDVTIRHLDRTGALTPNHFTVLASTDRPAVTEIFEEDGTAVVRVPKGTYGLLSFVVTETGEGEEAEAVVALMAQPAVEVTRDLTVDVDSRRARPISVTVPRADASVVNVDALAEVVTDEFGVGFIAGAATLDGLVTGRLGPDRRYPWFRSELGPTFAKVSADGDLTNSPLAYVLSWRVDGTFFTGFNRRVRQADLAAVRSAHARQGPEQAVRFTFPVQPGAGSASAIGFPLRLPFTQTTYFNTDDGVAWQSNMDELIETEESIEFLSTLFGPTLRYRAGRSYAEQWNRAVFGPSLLDPVVPVEYLTRTGDTMLVLVPTHSDSEHRAGYSALTSASVTIHRNGVKVAEAADAFAELAVPAAAGRYRVEVNTERAAPAALSTRTSTAWTFRSGHVSGDAPKRLPISVVRFAPELSQHNSAPAGRAFAVPVTVQRQPDSAAAACVRLAVQVSYDDGRTWSGVRMTGSGGRRVAHLRHPDRAGFVSLRAQATDAAGNTVQQTIVRAYRTV
jgi:subtilisin family serine protease